MTIIKFSSETNIKNWHVINDGVMGGLSQSKFYLNEDGKGVFKGEVSLENNGGFSTVKYKLKPLNVIDYSRVRIKLKGDGKRYQFRIKEKETDRHSYVSYFETSGEWEVIEFELDKLYPTLRGRKLVIPNFESEVIGEIGFLIGNKKNEKFELKIDTIDLI
ncbi:CIA30 family protein [Urechidicola croceus]|uniref:CIA30 family protein n=1 Tax=Urechidicola croceus TaxID=1850246 RepID=A0A1D8PBS4_9FLAO|nr:CIA30 family protein [Urechidicola croceus]AOW22037.1 CIA30 family protein [Urechidicola croceus]